MTEERVIFVSYISHNILSVNLNEMPLRRFSVVSNHFRHDGNAFVHFSLGNINEIHKQKYGYIFYIIYAKTSTLNEAQVLLFLVRIYRKPRELIKPVKSDGTLQNDCTQCYRIH